MDSVRVWDLPTRIGHWALAVLVILAILTGEEDGVLYVVHVFCGIGAGMIVLFRLFWGVVGNERARFADFVFGWRRVQAYAGRLLRLRPERFLGHNPLGGWMVVALLAVVLLTAGTGMVAGGLAGSGLARAAKAVHETLGSLLQVMIVVHIAGVLADWLLTGDNLIAAMINGRKRVDKAIAGESANADRARDARGGSTWWALLVAVPLIFLGGWLYTQVDPAAPPAAAGERSRD